MNDVKKRKISTTVLVKASLLTAVSIVLTRFFSYMIPLGGLPALRIGFGNIPLILAGMMFGPLVGGIVGVVSDLVGYMITPMGGTFFPGFTLTAALYGIFSGILFKHFKIHKMKINFNYINAVVMVLFAVGVIWVMVQSEVLASVDGKFVLEDASALPMLGLMVLVTLAFIAMPFVIGKRYAHLDQKLAFDKIAFTVGVTYVINALFLNTYWLTIMFDKGFVFMLPGRIIASVITIPIYSWIIYTLSKFINLTEN